MSFHSSSIATYKLPAILSGVHMPSHPIDPVKQKIYKDLEKNIPANIFNQICQAAWRFSINHQFDFWDYSSLLGTPHFQCFLDNPGNTPPFKSVDGRIYIELSNGKKSEEGSDKKSLRIFERQAYLISFLADGTFQREKTGFVKKRIIFPSSPIKLVNINAEDLEVLQKKYGKNFGISEEFKIDEKDLEKYGVKGINGFIDGRCYIGIKSKRQKLVIYYGSQGIPAGKQDQGDSKNNAANESASSANAGAVVVVKDES